MIQYPNDGTKEEYTNQLLHNYKNKYLLTEEVIKISIEVVISNLKMILDKSVVVPSNTRIYSNIKMLNRLFDFSHPQYVEISHYLLPKQCFTALYFLGISSENVIKFLLRDKVENFDFLENDRKQQYLTFVSEMTKQCVREITQATEKTIAYETKRAYEEEIENIDDSSSNKKEPVKMGIIKLIADQNTHKRSRESDTDDHSSRSSKKVHFNFQTEAPNQSIDDKKTGTEKENTSNESAPQM